MYMCVPELLSCQLLSNSVGGKLTHVNKCVEFSLYILAWTALQLPGNSQVNLRCDADAQN